MPAQAVAWPYMSIASSSTTCGSSSTICTATLRTRRPATTGCVPSTPLSMMATFTPASGCAAPCPLTVELAQRGGAHKLVAGLGHERLGPRRQDGIGQARRPRPACAARTSRMSLTMSSSRSDMSRSCATRSTSCQNGTSSSVVETGGDRRHDSLERLARSSDAVSSWRRCAPARPGRAASCRAALGWRGWPRPPGARIRRAAPCRAARRWVTCACRAPGVRRACSRRR